MSSVEEKTNAAPTTNATGEISPVLVNALSSLTTPPVKENQDVKAPEKEETAAKEHPPLVDVQPPTWQELLRNNRAWASRQNPRFFARLRSVQEPDFLWIGCSDSRILSSTITGSTAGQIFVHRNIANLVVPTDFNVLCVLDYAVNHLKVKHIIVCGHYGCGGVHAAMSRKDYNKILNGWLRHIKMVYYHNKEELDSIEDDTEKENRLSELNVIQQVYNLAHTSTVQRVWRTEKTRPHLHGWVYDIGDGLIKPVVDLSPNSQVHSIFEYHM